MYALTPWRSPPSRPFLNLLCSLCTFPGAVSCERFWTVHRLFSAHFVSSTANAVNPRGRCTFPVHGAGLRLAEALALRPADVNLDNGDIWVLHGKGDRDRTVGVDDGALVHLARWMDKRRTRDDVLVN